MRTKRKCLRALATACVLLTAVCGAAAPHVASAAGEGIFAQVPDNWLLSEESDTASTTTSVQDGCLTVRHTNAAVTPSQYYGALYRIDTDKAYSDFTFSITVRMTQPQDVGRWFGIMYHTQQQGDSTVGYLMNYRYSGKTASSVVTSARGFSDDAKDQGPALSDNGWHTLKIEMSGTTAKHYMDDQLIKTWDVKSKDALLGTTLMSGGFALIVNRCTLEVKSYSVTGTEVKMPVTDDTLVSTYRTGVKAKNAPTVVCDVTDRAALDALIAGDERPSNAILRFDADYNAVGKDGGVLGKFADIYNTVLKGKIIPVLYLKDDAAATAAIKFFEEEIDILDLAVMSDDPAVVKKVREANNKIRGIVSFGTAADLYDIVKTTHANLANVAVIPQSKATVENVRYIQARFKTVWVTADGAAASDLYTCINSGAYGVITTDFSSVYGLLRGYAATALFRAPFNVAHRGLPEKCNENSVSGVKAAIAGGATHVELDGYLTTDNEIVLMHDNTIDRTSNGSGSVESMSLEQLRKYKLDLHGEEDIPTLQDVIAVLKDSDTVLVFEIKSYNPKLVPRLKEILDQTQFYEQIVVISVAVNMLGEMKNILPQVPTANLNTTTRTTFKSDLYWIGQLNTGVDTNYGNASVQLNEYYLRDRGIVGWYWTFVNRAAINEAADLGYVGLTNNEADAYAANLQYLKGNAAVMETLVVGDTVKCTMTTYAGAEKAVDGKVFALTEYADRWEAVATYKARKDFYTQTFTVMKAHPDVPEEDAKPSGCGCGSAVGGGAGTLALVLTAGVCAWLTKRRACR